VGKEELCQVEGKVVRCSHIKGHVHDIGVRFGSPLPVEALLQVSDTGPGGGKCQFPSLLCLLEEMTELTRNGADLSVISPMLQDLMQAIETRNGEAKSSKAA
jgi:hypothetical protein